jgi:hypothetical protein
MLRLRRLAALLLAAPLLAACSGDDPIPPEDQDPPVPAECDPLVPTACALPFPSDKYRIDGRLSFPEGSLPRSANTGEHIDPAAFADHDGFSPGVAAMAHLPGATTAGFPTPDSIERSLEPDCPTVLLDAATGERVPHWAELDMSNGDDARRALLIHPAVRLKDSTRYVVALRKVVDEAGAPLPPTRAFRALRDGTAYDHPSIEPRRALYDDLLGRLEVAGVPRADLQLAWDYTTASRADHTAWALAMRDDALAQVGAAGPAYVIDEVLDAPDEGIARRIEGRMTVPLYLDMPETGASVTLGADGLPVQNGTAEYGFTVLIPEGATTGTPGALLQYGHGLLGSRGEVGAGDVRELATRHNFVVFATDWIGMAEDDAVGVADVIASGDIAAFRHTPERSLQGFVNALLAMRMMSGAFAADPAASFGGVSAIDPAQRYYFGNSQGGILGGCYMALSTDVARGVLGVPGQPYNVLLNRSADFGVFFVLMRGAFPDAIDQQMALALVQTLWDRAEPNGYTPYVGAADPLPGTPAHDVLLHVAIGDHQVSPLGAHIMARAVGAKSLAPAVRPIWGVEEAPGPLTGSAIVEFDFGVPTAPIENVPMELGDDPHGKVRKLHEAQDQINTFLRTGVIENTCGGPCSFE